jgi:hypothetical protein
MNTNDLQEKYFNALTENYLLHCQNGGDYLSFKNILSFDFFQKADDLIINEVIVNWCFRETIIEFWDEKLISDLLLIVNEEDLRINKFDKADANKSPFIYYYFENYFDFIEAKDKFLKVFEN